MGKSIRSNIQIQKKKKRFFYSVFLSSGRLNITVSNKRGVEQREKPQLLKQPRPSCFAAKDEE
jgi:hypothetical protein